MPSGPALTFDPRYVIAAIEAWRVQGLNPSSVSDLEHVVTDQIRDRFIAWNIMGMREQSVSASAVTRAVGIFTALKLAKRNTRGKGESRIAVLTPTAEGRKVLSEEPVGGVLYPLFVECLSNAIPDLRNLLDLLGQHGPFSQPVLCLTSDAPRRGAAYRAAISEGLREYRVQAPTPVNVPRLPYELENSRATPAQRIRAAQIWAAQAHPVGTLRQLDKVIAIGLAFGLLWVDTVQVNEIIGGKSVGLAANRTGIGYRPNALSWPTDSGAFIPALISAIAARANGSGFATIQEVRGAVGRKLNLSPAAVDVLLREARDAGDRHEISVELHFEPDEDQLYALQRDPLVWREEAFEFITIMRGSRT